MSRRPSKKRRALKWDEGDGAYREAWAHLVPEAVEQDIVRLWSRRDHAGIWSRNTSIGYAAIVVPRDGLRRFAVQFVVERVMTRTPSFLDAPIRVLVRGDAGAFGVDV